MSLAGHRQPSLSFANKEEWNGTKIVFDIAKKGDKTEVRLTHVGLAPAVECYDRCSRAWSFFITDGLKKRILAGKTWRSYSTPKGGSFANGSRVPGRARRDYDQAANARSCKEVR